MKQRSIAALLIEDKMLLLQSSPLIGSQIYFCSASILEVRKDFLKFGKRKLATG